MTSNYKLQVKVGNSEFAAEGAEATVKAAFAEFLALTKINPPKGTAIAAADEGSSDPQAGGISPQLLERVFLRDGDIVSLRHMPPEESTAKNADAAILIMYGISRLLNVQDVGVIKLNKGLVKTGITVDRVDRLLSTHTKYFMKGGNRSGSYYTLNNQGERQAETWIKAWFSKK